MMRQAQGKNPTRQSTKSVSTRSMSLEIVGGGELDLQVVV